MGPKIPEKIDGEMIDRWNFSQHVSQWSVELHQPAIYKSEPEVVCLDLSRNVTLQVKFADGRDGVHLLFFPFPERREPPFLHLIFKDRKQWGSSELNKVISAFLACIGMRAIKPRLSRRKSEHGIWLRTVFEKLRKLVSGPESYVNSTILEAVAQSQKRFNSVARLDVTEALERTRKEFLILINNGICEDDILREFRELQVSLTLKE